MHGWHWKRWLWLGGTVLVATVAAAWRWPDSAHVLAVLRGGGGGSARHPLVLQPGPGRYMVVLTAPVAPPWHGDARLAIEGKPALDFEAHMSAPAVDLGLHHLPKLDGRILRGLAPGDRIALRISVNAPELDPVCGMRCAGEPELEAGGHCFCSAHCRDAFLQDPGRYGQAGYRGQELRLTMRDDHTGQPILSVPIVLGGKGGRHGDHH
jgi:YHS domain-containing protein